MLRLRNSSIADDGACLWSWFGSVQAATHHEHGDRTRTAHHSGWDVPFWFAVSSPLLGVLVVLLVLTIFAGDPQPKSITPTVWFRRLAEYVFAPGIPLARAQGGSAAPSGDAKRQSGEAAHNELHVPMINPTPRGSNRTSACDVAN
jgi:hypothetical protein